MRPDDEVCLCFHVTRRKVEQYLRLHRPAVASQLSECFGAGTGCGWCRPYLKRLHQTSLAAKPRSSSPAAPDPQADPAAEPDLPAAADYAAARSRYRDRRRADDD